MNTKRLTPAAVVALMLSGCAVQPDRTYAETFGRSRQPTPVQTLIVQKFRAELGEKWVKPALRIAKIESGFNCRAHNGKAVGLFQFTAPERWGLSRHRAMNCNANVDAAVRYAKHCVAMGATNFAHLGRCWNSGQPFSHVRLEPAYRLALGRR